MNVRSGLYSDSTTNDATVFNEMARMIHENHKCINIIH